MSPIMDARNLVPAGPNPAGSGLAIQTAGGAVSGALTLAELARPRTGIVPAGSNLIRVVSTELPRRTGTSAGFPGLLIAAPTSTEALTRGPTPGGVSLPTQAFRPSTPDLEVSGSQTPQSGNTPSLVRNGRQKDCCCCCPKDTPSGTNTVWSPPKFTTSQSGGMDQIFSPTGPDVFPSQPGSGQQGVTYTPGRSDPQTGII